MPFQQYFWHRPPAIDVALLKHFADFIGPGKLVVDVGAGYDPWPHATEFVDCEAWPELAGKKVHALDIELDRLPFADKSVDFLYCRHTIEDLHNPTLLLREMNRVAKAGYIETPSPLAETCRGVDGVQGADWRGYIHHYWMTWSDGQRLNLLPKLPVIEYTKQTAKFDATILKVLSAHPIAWNTYFAWKGGFEFAIRGSSSGLEIHIEYMQVLSEALNGCQASIARFCADFSISDASFVGINSARRFAAEHSPDAPQQ
jgi:SAM-dependent methyltransferase